MTHPLALRVLTVNIHKGFAHFSRRFVLHDLVARCAGMQEFYVRAQGRAARTSPALLPMLRLDRIYVRNARAQRPLPLPRLPWARLSDLAPLAAEISL